MKSMPRNIQLLLFLINIIVIFTLIIASIFIRPITNEKDTGDSIRVACIGDSITEATDYPDDLWTLLGANYTVENFGVGGSTVSSDSDRPYIKQNAFQNAKEFQPKMVIIMLGTNDANPSLEQNNASFIANYVKLVNDFQGLESKPKIWVVKPPPIFSAELGLSPQYFEANVIPSIEEVARRMNLSTINIYSALIKYPNHFPDGVHPDSEGSKFIAAEVHKAIVTG